MRSKGKAKANAGTATLDSVPCIPLENLPSAALITDTLGRVVHANQRAAALLELPLSMLRGMTVVELLGRDLLLSTSGASGATLPLVLPLPSRRNLQVIASISTLVDSDDQTRTIVVLTPTRLVGENVTGAAPRVASWVEVAERVAQIDAEMLCVAIGLTGVASINESFSRSTGDAVITEIGRRLESASPAGTIVERIGGHRYVLVTPLPADVHRTLDGILAAVREPIETTLGGAVVGCAAGVTTGPSRPPLVLLDRADRNLTAALGRGGGVVEWADRVRPAAAAPHGRLGAPLLAGIARRAISAYFQPVVDMVTGDVVEYEALARWNDDDGAQQNAERFIGVAEDTGVLREVSTQVLQAALELAVHLRGAEMEPPRVSVNVSAAELADVEFAPRVRAMLAATSVAPAALQFEITESIAPLQRADAEVNIRLLRDQGVRFALDGFGSRTADLLSLRDFDVDILKLDPALTLRALTDARSLIVLRAVLSLADQLGYEVIAKGVETAELHEFLVQFGCRYGQGFLYSPPRPMSELANCADFLASTNDSVLTSVPTLVPTMVPTLVPHI